MFRSLRSFAVLACIAMASCYHTIAATVAGISACALAAVKRIVHPALEMAAQPQMGTPPVVKVHRMREYRLSQERREVPVVTASWRMCPSA
jgi:hypothetical protein